MHNVPLTDLQSSHRNTKALLTTTMSTLDTVWSAV